MQLNRNFSSIITGTRNQSKPTWNEQWIFDKKCLSMFLLKFKCCQTTSAEKSVEGKKAGRSYDQIKRWTKTEQVRDNTLKTCCFFPIYFLWTFAVVNVLLINKLAMCTHMYKKQKKLAETTFYRNLAEKMCKSRETKFRKKVH